MNPRSTIKAVAGLLAMLLAGSPAPAQISPSVPPTTRVMDCTTSGCHGAQTSRQFLHGPNAVQACDACHEYTEAKDHKFQLKRKGRDLCDFCHIDKSGTEGPVVHKPVADGNCLGCHDPHGASNRRMLKKNTTPELCITCHTEAVCGSNVHSPVADDCMNCHKAHTANVPKLLTMDSRSLCLSCHQDVEGTIAAATHPHDPLKGDCLQCHSPHASNQIKALKMAPEALCATCHQDVAMTAFMAGHRHSAATDGRACVNCHTPHGSTRDKQLKADPIAACLACHKDQITVSKTKVIPAVPEVAASALHRHGPIEHDDCAACHTVHGGERDHLLVASLSTQFYQNFSEEAYEFCLTCHAKQLVLSKRTLTDTKFRDGDRNLHSVHVDSGPKGHSCRVCHTVHASRHESQINDAVPFGQWRLPINFAQTTSGGTCSPGCHRPSTYDRLKPLAPPTGSKPPAGGLLNPLATPGTPTADPKQKK